MNKQEPIQQSQDNGEDVKNQVFNINNTKLLAGIVVVLGVLVAVGAGVYFYGYKGEPKQTACTWEAKICPDGTAVGRTGPNCEFAECPGEEVAGIDTSDWKTYRNAEYGFTLEYPAGWGVREEYPEVDEHSEEAEIVLDLEIVSPDKQRVFLLFYLINDQRFYSTSVAEFSGAETIVVGGYKTAIEEEFMPYSVVAMVKRKKEGPDDGLEFRFGLYFYLDPQVPPVLLNNPSPLNNDDIKLFKTILSTFKFIE